MSLEIRLEVLSHRLFVLPRKGSTTRTLVEAAFAKAGLPFRVAVEAGGWEVVKRYVGLGLGISVIPEFCITPADPRTIAVRSARSLFGQETYGVVTKRRREVSAAARELIRQLSSGR